jgi:hypothetical protein
MEDDGAVIATATGDEKLEDAVVAGGVRLIVSLAVDDWWFESKAVTLTVFVPLTSAIPDAVQFSAPPKEAVPAYP